MIHHANELFLTEVSNKHRGFFPTLSILHIMKNSKFWHHNLLIFFRNHQNYDEMAKLHTEPRTHATTTIKISVDMARIHAKIINYKT